VQQTYRQSANDPQIHMAEDVAQQLDRGADPASLISGKVDIASSLAPFVIIYDQQANVLASSGELNGATPRAPGGVLMASVDMTSNRITWQPEQHTRIAAVVVSAVNHHQFVLAGRSLRETENRVNSLMQIIVAGWMLTLALTLITTLILGKWRNVSK